MGGHFQTLLQTSRTLTQPDQENDVLQDPAGSTRELAWPQEIQPTIPGCCDLLEVPALNRNTVSIMSPLRYPGSKRRLAHYIKRAIELNGLRPSLFVEPFAGGASVALQLLKDEVVESIGLADLDPLVAAFWQVTFYDTDWLVNQVLTIDVTIDKWREFKYSTHAGPRDKALACLFLNRTSFSGILAPSAGPIGGTKQTSEYRLDCRFPRETIVKRILDIASLADRVKFVWNCSWRDTILEIEQMQSSAAPPSSVFFYFDPPFFEKAERLYTFYFSDSDHECLRDVISELEDCWVLSYDVADKLKELYADAGISGTQVEVLYSTARGVGNRQAKEAIVTNLRRLPSEARLWRKSEEWDSASRTQTANQHESMPGRLAGPDDLVKLISDPRS